MTARLVGEVLAGKYRIGRVMAEGSRSTVFRAQEAETERPVAIKILHRSGANTSVELERFLTEARRAATIANEHVVQVLDVGVLETGEPFLVMEYVEGEDLSEYARLSSKKLEVETAVEYALQALQGLAAAHAVGIVHRHLALSSILLTKRPDGSPLLKILGFPAFHFSESQNALTAPDVKFIGSPYYMAPEQITRPWQIDGQVDIWALGVVLYNLLTGVNPFRADNLQSVLSNIIGKRPASPSTLRRDLPEALDVVVLRCLEKSPDNRFRSATELVAALHPFALPRARSSASQIDHWSGAPEPLNLQRPQGYRLPWPEPAGHLKEGQGTKRDAIKSEDHLLRMLTATARDEMLEDPCWEALAVGTLPERDVQDLRALAERSDSAREAFELFRPLTPEERAALAERVLSKIPDAPAAPTPEAWWRPLVVPFAAATSLAIAAALARMAVAALVVSAPARSYELIVYGALAGGIAFIAIRASRLARGLKKVEAENKAVRAEKSRLQAGNQVLKVKLEEAAAEVQKRTAWLEHTEVEIQWLRGELDKRPRVLKKKYNIMTLGLESTGKKSITLRLADPRFDLGRIHGTKIERYEVPVSRVIQPALTVDHVFQLIDWGGEHIVDAQQEQTRESIDAMLIVVDLGRRGATELEPQRVQEQLREFEPRALRFFFGPRMVTSCKTVVLFINKSDLIPGTLAEVVEQAKQLYAPLIDELMRYSTQLDVRVIVGSASNGRGIQELFIHFVEKILPSDAYDKQLLQRIR